MRAFHAAFLRDGLWISLTTFALAAAIYLWLPLSDAIKTALLFGCLSAPAAAAIRINIIALGAILVCVAGAILFGPWAFRVFGAEYEVGHWPLVLFMVSQAFRAASGMNQHLLSLAGYQIKTAGSCLVAVAALIGGTALLTPGFGVMGLALAVVIADAVWPCFWPFRLSVSPGVAAT